MRTYHTAGNIESLNLAELVEFKFVGGVSGLFIKERCRLLLEVLEQSHEFANLQEIKLAAC